MVETVVCRGHPRPSHHHPWHGSVSCPRGDGFRPRKRAHSHVKKLFRQPIVSHCIPELRLCRQIHERRELVVLDREHKITRMTTFFRMNGGHLQQHFTYPIRVLYLTLSILPFKGGGFHYQRQQLQHLTRKVGYYVLELEGFTCQRSHGSYSRLISLCDFLLSLEQQPVSVCRVKKESLQPRTKVLCRCFQPKYLSLLQGLAAHFFFLESRVYEQLTTHQQQQ